MQVEEGGLVNIILKKLTSRLLTLELEIRSMTTKVGENP